MTSTTLESAATVRLPRLNWDRLALALFLIALLLVVTTFADYGTTWDEDAHHWHGVLVLDYHLSGFREMIVVGRPLH